MGIAAELAQRMKNDPNFRTRKNGGETRGLQGEKDRNALGVNKLGQSTRMTTHETRLRYGQVRPRSIRCSGRRSALQMKGRPEVDTTLSRQNRRNR